MTYVLCYSLSDGGVLIVAPYTYYSSPHQSICNTGHTHIAVYEISIVVI